MSPARFDMSHSRLEAHQYGYGDRRTYGACSRSRSHRCRRPTAGASPRRRRTGGGGHLGRPWPGWATTPAGSTTRSPPPTGCAPRDRHPDRSRRPPRHQSAPHRAKLLRLAVAPTGGWVTTEDDRLDPHPAEAFRRTFAAIVKPETLIGGRASGWFYATGACMGPAPR